MKFKKRLSVLATTILVQTVFFATDASVMMVIVVVCMAVMNHFGEGEEQAVML